MFYILVLYSYFIFLFYIFVIRLVIGDDNGNVIIYDVEANTKRKLKTTHQVSSVVELHWDPLSENYLLAAFKNGN